MGCSGGSSPQQDAPLGRKPRGDRQFRGRGGLHAFVSEDLGLVVGARTGIDARVREPSEFCW